MNKAFSVSICVYGKDNPVWFKVAVESILNQTIKPNEIVLVVDGPLSDELNCIVSSFDGNSIFKIIRFKENKGHGEARRAGLLACSNELVAIMDSDDISEPNRFEKQLDFFCANPDIDIVGGQISEFIGDINNVVGRRIVPTTDLKIKQYLKKRCPMNLVTVMFKKSSIERVGGFVDWYCEEDYYLWIRMFLVDMIFANVEDNLVNVRVGNDMYSRRGGFKYFKSEAKLQAYMFEKRIISFLRYVINLSERFVIQVLLPNKIRKFLYLNFARIK